MPLTVPGVTMLQTIRERFTGVMAVLIIAAMVIALTITLRKQRNVHRWRAFAARVNGEEIPLADFRQVLSSRCCSRRRLRARRCRPRPQPQLERNVLEGMVRNRVVAQYVKSEGYRVSDQRVVETIQSHRRLSGRWQVFQ